MRSFAALCAELDRHVDQLSRSLALGSTVTSGSAHAKPGSRPPLNLSVSGLLAEMAETVHALDLRATDALGFHPRAGRGTLAVRRALAALPSLMEAIDGRDPRSSLPASAYEQLDDLRSHARATLQLDPPLLKFDAPCPECGERKLTGRLDVVFCRNRACGLTCGRDDCGCACLCPSPVIPLAPLPCGCGRRLHQTRWERDHLALLSARLDEQDTA